MSRPAREAHPLHASGENERYQLTVERDRIQDQRRASLQAHYAGALPLDLLKEEQDRLARQIDLVTARLDALDTTYEEARTWVRVRRMEWSRSHRRRTAGQPWPARQ